MNDEPRDHDLDAAYREATQGHQAMRPPPELDAKILAAAHRAVAARPVDAARRGWFDRNRVPLSLAASLVLAVTVTLMVQEEERAPKMDAPVSAPVPKATVVPASPAPSPPAAASRADEQRAVPPAELKKDAVPSAFEPARKQSGTVAPAPAVAPEPPVPPADGPPPMQAPPRPAAAPAPPARPAPPPAAAEGVNVAPQAAPLARERALADRPGRAEREQQVPAAAGAVAPRPPEAWLAEIRRLKAEGRETEAQAQLTEFIKRYPDFTLPDDLRRP